MTGSVVERQKEQVRQCSLATHYGKYVINRFLSRHLYFQFINACYSLRNKLEGRQEEQWEDGV